MTTPKAIYINQSAYAKIIGTIYLSGITDVTLTSETNYNVLTYNGSNWVNGLTVRSVSSSTTNQLTVANGTTTPALSIVTSAVSNGETALATGDQIYDFVIGLGYSTTTGTVSNVSSSTTNQLTVANETTTPTISIVTGSVVNSGTALATGDQIYDFVIGLDYVTVTNANSDYAYKNGTGTEDFATNNLTVANDLTVTGKIISVEIEYVKSENDLIITRYLATTGLIPGDYTGIQATKYDGTNDGQLVFGSDGFARVGDVGDLQILATREDSPISNGIAYFDTTTKQFKTKAENTLSVSNADTLDSYHASAFPRKSESVSITGSWSFEDDILVYAKLFDVDDYAGTTGEALTSDGDNVYWAGGTGSGLDADKLDGYHGTSYLRSDANDTTSGNLTVGSTSKTSDSNLIINAGNAYTATISAYGSSQGTGVVYVGQSITYGGGIAYNGDDNPDKPYTTDHTSFFRRSVGVDYEVFRYSIGSNDVIFEGLIKSQNGTASDPTFSFESDTNTGMYRPGSETLAFTTAGVQRMHMSTVGVVINEGSNDYDFRVESNAFSHMLYIDGGSNYLGINKSDPKTRLDVGGTIRSVSSSQPTSGTGLEMYFTSGNAYIHPFDRSTPGYEGELNIRATVIRLDAAEASSTTTYSGLDIAKTGFIFNDNSLDMDFRVESNYHTYSLFMDGSNSKWNLGECSVNTMYKVLNVWTDNSNTNIITNVGRTADDDNLFLWNNNTGSGVYSNIDFATNDGYPTTYNAARIAWKGYSSGSTSGNYLSFVMYDSGFKEQFRFTRLGALHAEDNIISYSTTITSDERLKSNIKTIEEDSLSKILSLRPVTFDWKYKPKDYRSSGYIAQEFEKLFPDLIMESEKINDKSGLIYKHIRYNELIPHITNAIKQQQEIIIKQQEEINLLKIK